jgi:hypothetical protein
MSGFAVVMAGGDAGVRRHELYGSRTRTPCVQSLRAVWAALTALADLGRRRFDVARLGACIADLVRLCFAWLVRAFAGPPRPCFIAATREAVQARTSSVGCLLKPLPRNRGATPPWERFAVVFSRPQRKED